MATTMLWRSTFVRAVPWRACTRITTARATVAAPLRMARFYSQDPPSGIHKQGQTQTQQGQEKTKEVATATGNDPLAASEPTGASTEAATAPEVEYPPKEELTPLAKHIRDSIKVHICPCAFSRSIGRERQVVFYSPKHTLVFKCCRSKAPCPFRTLCARSSLTHLADTT